MIVEIDNLKIADYFYFSQIFALEICLRKA